MMAVKCAEADALRSAFPTTTGGLYISEEMGRAPSTVENTPPVALLPDADDEDDESEFAPSKEKKFRTSQGKHDDQAVEEVEGGLL